MEVEEQAIGTMQAQVPGQEPAPQEEVVTETQDIEEQPAEPSKDEEFNFEEFEYEDEQPYVLEEYNFEQEDIEGLRPSLDKFKEAGITQDQLNVIFEEIMANPEEQAPVMTTREVLEKGLTRNELMSYKASIPMGKQIAELAGMDVKEVMEDPKTAKMIIAFNSLQNQPQQTLTTPNQASAGLTNEDVDAQFKTLFSKANISRDQRKQLATKLLNEASDKGYAQNKLKGLLG